MNGVIKKKKKRSNKYGRHKGTFAPASMLDLRILIERIRSSITTGSRFDLLLDMEPAYDIRVLKLLK